MPDIRRKGMIPAGPGLPPVEAELMEIEKSNEQWSDYKLDDGTVIRTKPVALEIWRLANVYDAEGNPMYVLKAQPVMVVTTPPALKKKDLGGVKQ